MWRYSTQQTVNTKMLWRKMSSKLILNTPKIMAKSQKIDLEILSGLTYHSTKKYPQILQKCFFDWSIDIFLSLIDYIKFSIVKTSYSCIQNMSKIYKRHNSNITSPLCNQLTSCNCRKKGERSMGGKCQTVDAVYDCCVTLSEPQSTLRWFIVIKSQTIFTWDDTFKASEVNCGCNS